MPADAAELYDTWLSPNGIHGWLPEEATILVEDGRVTYPAWHHLDGAVGGWGYDVKVMSDDYPGMGQAPGWGEPVVTVRTMPLLVPVTDRVRDLFQGSGLALIERWSYGAVATAQPVLSLRQSLAVLGGEVAACAHLGASRRSNPQPGEAVPYPEGLEHRVAFLRGEQSDAGHRGAGPHDLPQFGARGHGGKDGGWSLVEGGLPAVEPQMGSAVGVDLAQ